MTGLLGYDMPVEEVGDESRLSQAASKVMEVQSVRWLDDTTDRGRRRREGIGSRLLEIRGRLSMESEEAYEWLAPRFKELGYILLFRRVGQDDLAVAMPGELPERAGRMPVAIGLFVATLLSVLWVGASYDAAPGQELNLLSGIPFAASLLGILLCHEMGHYIVARWQRVPASPPYFIPLPLTLLGTMGAVIQTKAPPRNRRSLLFLGAAGPWAGMAIALPVIVLGLSMSRVQQIPVGAPIFQEGNSLLYAALKIAIFGRFLPSGGEDVFISSVALAGWAGILVTGMNLIPAGQLDGGHIAYAMFGQKARYFTYIIIAGLLGLSILWQGWLLWAALLYFLGRVHSVPLDDITPLRPREKLLVGLSFLLFVMTFVPIPMVIG